MDTMYKVTFFAFQDGERHEMYVPERVVADICCRWEYHLIRAEFMYSYMKIDLKVSLAESIEEIEELVGSSTEMRTAV